MEKKDTQKEITIHDKEYPALLKQIKNAPKALYVKGDASILSLPCVAIVGTRKASGEGMTLAQNIAQELARAGLVIVSGLAQGIDSAAHKGALEAYGKTIGVLGSSLEERFFFPSQNSSLSRKMIEIGGALVSEYEKDTPALRHHFIARNRIVAGLSLGVIVIEAPQKSGALITAEFARKETRIVCAIPGSPFSSAARGGNNLIKKGAHLVEGAKDVLEILQKETLFFPIKKLYPQRAFSLGGFSVQEATIITCLEEGQIHIDKLAQKTKVEVPALLSLLIELELKGMVQNIGGGNYVITKNYEDTQAG